MKTPLQIKTKLFEQNTLNILQVPAVPSDS